MVLCRQTLVAVDVVSAFQGLSHFLIQRNPFNNLSRKEPFILASPADAIGEGVLGAVLFSCPMES